MYTDAWIDGRSQEGFQADFSNHTSEYYYGIAIAEGPCLLLTHWGRVTHICVSKLTIIGSDNGLSPGRRQAIIWTNAGTLLIRLLEINFSEILIKIHTFSFKKIHLNMSSGKWRPFLLGLNVLNAVHSLKCCSFWNQHIHNWQYTYENS